MAKLIIPFEIPYPLRKKRVRDLKIVTDNLGQLMVHGSYEKQGDLVSINIDFVRLNGMDITPALEAFDLIYEIDEFCMRQANKFFHPKAKEAIC